jgi:TRAP-type C4-dicarboxylate transport system permease small subunit
MILLFRTILHFTEKISVYVAVAATFIMMCLTSADATGRYLFNTPLAGADEITEKYLMVAAVFFGVCYAYRGGAFIRVSFLVDRLPRLSKIAVNYLVQAVSALIAIVFVVATVKRAVPAFVEGTNMVTVPVPLGPAYVLVCIGFFLLSIVLLDDLSCVSAGKSDLFKDGESTAGAA